MADTIILVLGILLFLWLTYVAFLVRIGIIRVQAAKIISAHHLIDEIVLMTHEYEAAEPLATQAIRYHITQWQIAQLKETTKK